MIYLNNYYLFIETLNAGVELKQFILFVSWKCPQRAQELHYGCSIREGEGRYITRFSLV